MSLCVYTILFTLSGRSYVDMFMIWMSCIVKNAGLDGNDLLVVFLDQKSFDLIQKPFLESMLAKLRCKYKFCICPPVSDVLSGMMMKYIPFEYSQDAIMYLDIDVMVLKDLHNHYNGIVVHPEGLLKNDNYGASCSGPKEGYGYSAGKFVIGDKNLRNKLFKRVAECAASSRGDYYCVEQPFFNEALLDFKCLNYMTAPEICTNLHNYTNKCMLLDLCGEPGKGDIHLEKMLNVLCLLNSGVLGG